MILKLKPINYNTMIMNILVKHKILIQKKNILITKIIKVYNNKVKLYHQNNLNNINTKINIIIFHKNFNKHYHLNSLMKMKFYLLNNINKNSKKTFHNSFNKHLNSLMKMKFINNLKINKITK